MGAAEGFDQYLWIVITGGLLAFCYGFLIGANDVANAFASSVSSKSLTLKQAVLVASICEFSGAFFLGARVTGTIRNKIVSIEEYEDRPDVLMFGMFTALLSASLMLWIATALGLPVSTTHDIIACIMGFSIAAKGFDSIEWDVVRKLVLSWIASPLIAGSVSFVFFYTIKTFVLTAANPFQRAFHTFPIVITIGIGIDLFYVLYKGANNTKFEEKMTVAATVPMCFGIGFAISLLWTFFLGNMAKKRIEERFRLEDEAVEAKEMEVTKGIEQGDVRQVNVDDYEEVFVDEYNTDAVVEKPKAVVVAPLAAASEVPKTLVAPEQAATVQPQGIMAGIGNHLFNQDLHAQSMHESKGAARIWDEGVTYDPKAEALFNYIQVFTASLNSFAHGANDVSNTIAPFSAIIQIYHQGIVKSQSGVDLWILAFGGGAIVIGLLTWGYNVMKSLGYKLTKLSPSRGATAELAASLTVVTASFLEIPVSSTQCIVGAISGVGLVNGVKNVEWFFLLKVCFGWVVMFFTACVLSAGVFAFAAFSPDL